MAVFDAVKNGSEGNCSCHSPEPYQLGWSGLGLLTLPVLALAGNIMVCAAVIRRRSLRNGLGISAASMALCDILYSSLVMSVAVARTVSGKYTEL